MNSHVPHKWSPVLTKQRNRSANGGPNGNWVNTVYQTPLEGCRVPDSAELAMGCALPMDLALTSPIRYIMLLV